MNKKEHRINLKHTLFEYFSQTLKKKKASPSNLVIDSSIFLSFDLVIPTTLKKFNNMVKDICEDKVMELKRPFEGSENISGLIIALNQKEIHKNQESGFLRLVFDENTTDLPFHIHPQSDRLILITKGEGYFCYSDRKINSTSIESIKKKDISAGTLIYFSKGLVHTFGTNFSKMEFISFHLPFIPLENELHFSVLDKDISTNKLNYV